MKTPSQKEKIAMYESFLHKINTFVILVDNEGIKELVTNADNFSYAHRRGNGELSDRQQQRLINSAFWKLCDTPETDRRIADRQRAYTHSRDENR
jgi:hypothetical protein